MFGSADEIAQHFLAVINSEKFHSIPGNNVENSYANFYVTLRYLRFRRFYMRLKPVTWLLIFLFFTAEKVTSEENYWQQFVNYQMDVTLLPIEHSVVGEQNIRYVNNSPDTLDRIYMHLYPNAYQDDNTIMASEARKFLRKTIESSEAAGRLEIESLAIAYPGATDSTVNLSYTPLEYQITDTILEAELPRPLLPGRTLCLQTSFKNIVRRHSRRSGYEGFQYDMAQWYPKIVVYDENGWNARPFHMLGEFYGEFGTFDVTIHTPPEYIIGATGEVVCGDPGWHLVKVDTSISDQVWPEELERIRKTLRERSGNGALRSVRFHAEQVHDFSWSACPDFLYERGEWDGIPIHVLYRASAKHAWSKLAVARSARALAWLSGKFGRYPYPQVTVVHGLLRGGMEYPMLVMNSSARESLILHEIGHIYFFGALGNNEWKEAWLDEGFTEFQERWYADVRYGEWGVDRRAFLRNANWLQRRRPVKTMREQYRDVLLAFQRSGHDEPLSQRAELYNEPHSYSTNVYVKGTFFLEMLRYVVGDSTFDVICRAYFEKWKFKHVNEDRFKRVCEEVSGQDLGWFFEQWLRATPKVDYELADVDRENRGDVWVTSAHVVRREDGIMPVEVQLTAEDGSVLRKRWDGVERTGTVSFETTSKPGHVVLDPDDQILDQKPSNNRHFGLRFVYEYPGADHSARKNYTITWRPGGWYNDIDKFRPGGRLRASNGVYHNAEVAVWYGTESQTLDFKFKYNHPMTALGARTRGYLRAQKAEGRRELDAHILFQKSRYFRHGHVHRVWLGFNHIRLIDSSYTLRSFDGPNRSTRQMWQSGDVNKLYIRYIVNPYGFRLFSNITLGLDISQKDWASDFNYGKLFSEVKLWYPSTAEGLLARGYGLAITDGQKTPIQELVYLDGANPRNQFRHTFLRSAGGLPDGLNYHMQGGGNLRGYFNNPIAGDGIIALNLEGRKLFKIPLLGRKATASLGKPELAAFLDLAKMETLSAGSKFYADAGFGLRFHSKLPDQWYTIITGGRDINLRFDFPIWLNKPLVGEEPLHFRWIFSLDYGL